MMKLKQAGISVAVAAALLGLTACGGGSGGTASSGGGTATVSGAITGFGSVYVNGIRYDTDSASIRMDGVAVGDDTALDEGMVVTMSVDSAGNVISIEYADELDGIVQLNNIALDGTLQVMGQTVDVSGANLVYEDNGLAVATPADILPGAVVEVSGYSNGDGTIYATRLELKAAVWNGISELELKGVVANLDGDAGTFELGGLVVDYTTAPAQLDDIPNDTLVDGLYVEVKSSEGFTAGDFLLGSLIASKVELEDDGDKEIDGDEGDDLELRGLITQDYDAGTGLFMLNGQPILVDGDLEFEDGHTVADLVAGAEVEVEGEFNGEGELVANEIEFEEREGSIELEGEVEAVDLVLQTITLMGRTIVVGDDAIKRDERDDEHRFNLDDIAADLDASITSWVEVKADEDAVSGNLIATKIERDDSQLSAELSGPVTAVAAGQIVVGGVTVDITAVGGFAPVVDDRVELEGSYAVGIFTATAGSIDI